MKVLGVVGSYRKGGNTDLCVQAVLEGVRAKGIETQLIYLSDYQFSDCKGCEGCQKGHRCVVQDDMQKLYPLLLKADGLVLGSPTYFADMTAITRSFINRLYCWLFFDKADRSVWAGLHEITGSKCAVTVAVCEQATSEDIGFTSKGMGVALGYVGYRIVEAVIALNLFEKGVVKEKPQQLENARAAGEKLANTLLLKQHVKAKL